MHREGRKSLTGTLFSFTSPKHNSRELATPYLAAPLPTSIFKARDKEIHNQHAPPSPSWSLEFSGKQIRHIASDSWLDGSDCAKCGRRGVWECPVMDLIQRVLRRGLQLAETWRWIRISKMERGTKRRHVWRPRDEKKAWEIWTYLNPA